MALVTVTNTVTDPEGNPIVNASVSVELIAGYGTAPAYTTTSSVLFSDTTTTNASGVWSMALVPNASLTPANTYYRITEGSLYKSTIVVPSNGGPFNLSQLLVVPGQVSGLAITGEQVANNGTVVAVRPGINFIPGTNMSISAVDNTATASVDVTFNGAAGTNFRGAWAPSTVYASRDLVTLGGELLLCNTPHTSGSTFSLANWSNLTGKTGVYNAMLYGAKGDGKSVSDLATTNTSTTVTSATANFTAADVGKSFLADNVAGGGVSLRGTIASVTNSTTAVLSVAAGATLTGQNFLWGTDDTAAINSAVTAAYNGETASGSFYAEVYCPPVTYVLAGATTIGGSTQGNAQIPLPVVGTTGRKFVLVLRGGRDAGSFAHWLQTVGQRAGAVFASTLLNLPVDGTYSVPSVVGGPTVSQGAGVYSNMKIVVDGITVLAPYNPSMVGFAFRYLAQATILSASAMANAGPAGSPALSTQPTNSQGLGLQMPQNGNNDCAVVIDYSCEGFYYGLSFGEHFTALRVAIVYANVAVFIGNIGGTSYHGASILNLNVEASAIEVQATGSGGAFPLFVGAQSVETTSVRSFDDPNNVLTGVINWSNSAGNSAPVVSGAANLKIICVNLASKPGAATSPGMPSSTTPLTNPFFRDAVVVVTGGTVSAVSVDGVAQGYAATGFTVIVPSGKTITLTYSVTPSWKWTLL